MGNDGAGVLVRSTPEPKHALVSLFRPKATSRRPAAAAAAAADFAVVNFHLDAMGENPHRSNQLRALAQELGRQALAATAAAITPAARRINTVGSL